MFTIGIIMYCEDLYFLSPLLQCYAIRHFLCAIDAVIISKLCIK